MDFIAIDFETANSNLAYPCSLGVTIVKNNEVVNCLSYLINPEGKFSPVNIKVHGITSDMVKCSPIFPDVWGNVSYLFQRYPVIAHNVSFDKTVLERTTNRYKIQLPKITYYCTMKLCQFNYPKAPGYSLNALCEFLNINLKHHHCCSDDSCAAANIMIKLTNDKNSSIFTYQNYSHACFGGERPRSHKSVYEKLFEEPDYASPNTSFDNNSDIAILGHHFCITGNINGIDRDAIKQKIIDAGGQYCNSVTKKTDFLVVGMENRNVVSDPTNAKSAKIIKAEQLKAQGQKIDIISCNQFLKVLGATK